MRNIANAGLLAGFLLFASVAAAVDPECPETSHAESSYDASRYLSSANYLARILEDQAPECFEALIILYRAGVPEGQQLPSHIPDSPLGQAIRYLITTPTFNMSFSRLMTILSTTDNAQLWDSVLNAIKYGGTIEVDETDPSKQLEWMPEDWDNRFLYTEALGRLTGNHAFWRRAMSEVLMQAPQDYLAANTYPKFEPDLDAMSGWLSEQSPHHVGLVIERLDSDLYPRLPDVVSPARLPPEQFVKVVQHIYSDESSSPPTTWLDHMEKHLGDWLANNMPPEFVTPVAWEGNENTPLKYRTRFLPDRSHFFEGIIAILRELPTGRAEAIIAALNRHESPQSRRYALLLELEFSPSAPLLRRLRDAELLSPPLIRDINGSEAREILLEGMDSGDQILLERLADHMSCTAMMRAGVSSELLGIDRNDASQAVSVIDRRLESGECRDIGLKPDVVGDVVFNPDGSFCFECYSEYNRRLVEWLDKLKAVQSRYTDKDSLSHDLVRLDDFRVSATGMLIHEECFVEDRWSFDVEKAVVDALVTTFERFIDLEKRVMEHTERGPSQIIRRHVPDFVDLYDPDNWQRSDVLSYYGTDSNGNRVEVNTEDPCSDLSSWAQHNNIDLKQGNNCRFAGHIEKGRPKLLCEVEEMGRNSEEFAERRNAYASIKGQGAFAIKNKDVETTIYQEPFIVFNPEGSKNFTDTRFQSTFIHEHFHNFGWEDFSRSHNSYSYFCQVAVFYQGTHEDVLDNEADYWGIEGCINSDYDLHNITRANHISRRTVLDKD